jgi:CHASE2 domain-containing sensor protein
MRQALWQRRKAALLIAVALIAAGLGTLAYTSHLLRRPEQETIDARFQIRGTERHRTAGLVLVNIDDTTFNYFRNHNLSGHRISRQNRSRQDQGYSTKP